jgi:hypothetical protein
MQQTWHVWIGSLVISLAIAPVATAVNVCGDAPFADSTEADEIRTSERTAAEDAWREYHESVRDALRTSPNPRDWALARLNAFGSVDHTDLDALLKQATQAAPDDALVQWIALSVWRSDARSAAPLQRLQQVEPDNAAVWMESVMTGAQKKDERAVDEALAKMSASTRFDNHLADISEALVEAYRRHPVPEETLALMPESQRPFSTDAIPLTYAMAITSATALPAFQYLVNACRVDVDSGKNNQRTADCATIGRLLMTHSDSLIAQRIGPALLRVSRTYTDDDLRVAREQDWIYKQYTQLLSGADDADSIARGIGYHQAWVASGSELEAMRQAVGKAGKGLTPPDDWVDDFSPFSVERLRADEERLQHSDN